MSKACVVKILLFATTGILMAQWFLLCRKAWLCHAYEKSFQRGDYTRATHFMRKLEQSYPRQKNPKREKLKNLLYCISEDKEAWYDEDVWKNVYEPVFWRRWKTFQEKFSRNEATGEHKELLLNSVGRMASGGSRQARFLLQSQILFVGLGINSEWALEIRAKAMGVIHKIGDYHVMKEMVLIHGNRLFCKENAKVELLYLILWELYPKLEPEEKKQVFPWILSSLNHEDYWVRWNAIYGARYGIKEIYAGLSAKEKKQVFSSLLSSLNLNLNHDDSVVRWRVIYCMGKIYTGLEAEEKKQVFASLLSFLNHETSVISVMEEIYAGLSPEEKKQAFACLLSSLNHDDFNVCCNAINCIKKIDLLDFFFKGMRYARKFCRTPQKIRER